MKIMKKILSGVMALTMAASALCMPAAAKTMDNGEHLYYTEIKDVKYEDGFTTDKNSYQLVFGPFDETEMKEINGILKKGHTVTIYSSFWYKDKGYYYPKVNLYGSNSKCEFWIDCDGDVPYVNAINISSEYEWADVEGGKELRILVYSAFDIIFDDADEICTGIFAIDSDYNTYTIKSGNDGFSWYLALNDPSMQATEKDISTLSISKISNKSYTGKSIKPAVTIKDGDKKLVKGTDYTVSYKNNTKIGTASVTIKGKGNYTGEKTLTFKIVPAKTTLKVSKKSDKKAVFSWTAVKGAEKYQLYYSVDGGKTYKKYTTISGSKTSYTTSKLNFKKYDYKFKIRAYDKVNKTTYYGSYSKIVSVK